jgi:hypothetical protein
MKPTSGASRLRQWLKRMGLAAFLFFFLKGIGWLVVLYFGADTLLNWLQN